MRHLAPSPGRQGEGGIVGDIRNRQPAVAPDFEGSMPGAVGPVGAHLNRTGTGGRSNVHDEERY